MKNNSVINAVCTRRTRRIPMFQIAAIQSNVSYDKKKKVKQKRKKKTANKLQQNEEEDESLTNLHKHNSQEHFPCLSQ